MSPRSYLRHAIQELLSPSRQSRSSRSRKNSRPLRLESLEPRLAMAVYAVQEPTALFGNLDQHSLSFAYPEFGSGATSKACGPAAALNPILTRETSSRMPSSTARVPPTTAGSRSWATNS